MPNMWLGPAKPDPKDEMLRRFDCYLADWRNAIWEWRRYKDALYLAKRWHGDGARVVRDLKRPGWFYVVRRDVPNFDTAVEGKDKLTAPLALRGYTRDHLKARRLGL